MMMKDLRELENIQETNEGLIETIETLRAQLSDSQQTAAKLGHQLELQSV
jgi:hypothetical protein